MATQLSVNLNAVAMLRNRRDLPWPSVSGVARIVLEAGAHGVTVHPRPDERHIRRNDVYTLNELLNTHYESKEYNIEGYPDARWIELVEEVCPDQATLVPDTPEQATSDHGWDLWSQKDFLDDVTARLKALGIRVSLFVDPDPAIADVLAEINADRIELYTGPFGGAFGSTAAKDYLEKMVQTSQAVQKRGIGVNAGHDLTLSSLPALVAAIADVREVSIGHGITADALLYGFDATVRRYLAALAPDT